MSLSYWACLVSVVVNFDKPSLHWDMRDLAELFPETRQNNYSGKISWMAVFLRGKYLRTILCPRGYLIRWLFTSLQLNNWSNGSATEFSWKRPQFVDMYSHSIYTHLSRKECQVLVASCLVLEGQFDRFVISPGDSRCYPNWSSCRETCYGFSAHLKNKSTININLCRRTPGRFTEVSQRFPSCQTCACTPTIFKPTLSCVIVNLKLKRGSA